MRNHITCGALQNDTNKNKTKMKRTFILSVAALAATALQAKVVNTQQALALAKNFRQTQVARGSLKAAPAKADMKLAYTSQNSELYVFNGSGDSGYVIVSGDDCSPSILGYSNTGKFDINDIPPAMKMWLDMYAEQVKASASAEVAYTATATADHAQIPHLMTTRWNQGAPYNDLCPIDTETDLLSYTGCVATAMAQVFNYHKWPEKASGVGMAYQNKTIPLTRDMNSDVFEWDKMLDVYATKLDTDSSGTAEQRRAVALLMVDLGYGVRMKYSSKSSGAMVTYIPVALINNFGYDKAAHLVFKNWYTAQDWDNIVYNELSTNGPVLFCGNTKDNEGHEFVCDGYDGNGYYTFNWGWGGKSDGKFLLSALNPKVQGAGGSKKQYAFDYNVSAVVDVRKPQAGSNYFWQFMNLTTMYLDFDQTTGQVYIAPGMMNISASDFTGEIGLKVVNTATNETTFYSDGKVLKVPFMGMPGEISDEPLSKLADGEYRVSAAFKPEGGAWTASSADLGLQSELLLTVKNGGRTYSCDEYKVYDMKVADLLFINNESTNFTFTLSTNGADHKGLISYKLIDTTTGETVYTSGERQFTNTLYAPVHNMAFQTPGCAIDTSHIYKVEFYDGGEAICHVDNVETSEKPYFEVYKPLSIDNMENGYVSPDADGLKLSLTLVNKSRSPFFGLTASTIIGDSDNPIVERLASPECFEANGDTIIFNANYKPKNVTFTDGMTGTVQIFVSLAETLTAIPYPSEQCVETFKIGSATAITGTGSDAAEIKTTAVYNMQGVCLGEYNGKAAIGKLPSGMYIVKSTDSLGNTKTSKVIQK